MIKGADVWLRAAAEPSLAPATVVGALDPGDDGQAQLLAA
jgi:hypothetical protein